MTVLNAFMLMGGLGLFLYGMNLMSEGFEKTAGDNLRKWLGLLTEKKIVGIGVGAAITAIIQSSSATTVMLVGFTNAGLMTLKQAMGVIMGASIGTTITGIIVAVKLTSIAPLFVFAGVIMVYFISKRRVKKIGLIILGFGVLFMGMGIMGDTLKPLGEWEVFQQIIIMMKNPILGVITGMVITSIIQSSSAFSGILIALSFQGLIGLEAAIPLTVGANIGTCATALLASIGTNGVAKQTATAHLIYKMTAAVIFMILYQFLPVTSWFQSVFEGVNWQIAAFNTVYNMFDCVLLFPFSDKIVALAQKIVPVKFDVDEEDHELKYVDEKTFATPTLVVPQLLREVDRMCAMSRKNLVRAVDAFLNGDDSGNEKLLRRENVINFLNHELTRLLVSSSGLEVSSMDRRIISELFHIVPDIERVADHAQNIMEYTVISVSEKLKFSDTALAGIRQLADKALETYDTAVKAYFSRDEQMFECVETLEEEVDALRDTLRNSHIERLNKGLCDAKSSMIFTDLLGDLERVGDHSINLVTAIYDSRAYHHD